MTTQNTSNKNLFTKQQYLDIKAAWKAATKSEYAKPRFVEETEVLAGTRYVERVKYPGWLQAEHHILYNLIRGKKAHAGFTIIGDPVKIMSGHILNQGYARAMFALIRHIRTAQEVVDRQNKDKQVGLRSTSREDKLNRFLEPFNGTITIIDLAQIETPDYTCIESMFGPGKTVASIVREHGRDAVDPDVVGMSWKQLGQYAEQLQQDMRGS